MTDSREIPRRDDREGLGNRRRCVLVTGGSGFIGSHVVDRFVAGGWHVHAPCMERGWPWRLEHLRQSPQLTHSQDWDVTDPSTVLDTITSIRPDVVVHAAAYGVHAQEANPFQSMSVNILGTGNLLEAAARSEVPRFVQIGSALEYSLTEDALTEQTALAPDTLYGATKAAASLLVGHYHDYRNLSTVVLRLFSCFGPREAPSKLIPYVITTALAGGEISLTSGEQLRDFLYVQDAVDAIVAAASGRLDGESVYNVSSGQLVRVRDVANRIVNLVGAGTISDIAHAPLRPQRAVLRGSPTALMQRGWEPRIPLDEGLRATIDWYSRAAERDHGC